MNLRKVLRYGLLGLGYGHPAVLSVAIRCGPRAAVRYLKEVFYCSRRAAGFYLPVVRADELICQSTNFSVFRPADPAEHYASLSLGEISILCALVAAYCPRKILEIGTYRGLTTLNLAMNSSKAICYTVDETNKWGSYIYSGRPEATRIRQFFGSTKTFNFGLIGDNVDFCLIDAGHSYGCVRNDTARVIRLIAALSSTGSARG